MESEFWLKAEDQTSLYIKKWFEPGVEPKAVIQLAHGMSEHIQRYNAFARFLTKQKFIVYGNDHRGHGKTGDNQGQLGYLADEDGFTKTSTDLVTISRAIKKEHPGVPLFILGHSMGSFLVRKYIQENSHLIDGAILSGTGFYPLITAYTGKNIANKLPAKKPSAFMNNLAFKPNNKRIKKPRTSFDWLTRDESIIDEYTNDPYAGFIPTARFFYDLMDGFIQLQNQKANSNIRTNLPILFISGDADPIGGYEKGVWKVARTYQKLGLDNIMVMLFLEGRHELLNETNKQEVFDFLNSWLNKQLNC